jgi:hypothetical protein
MADKNKGGRPKGTTKYTYDELSAMIDNYFADEGNKPYSILELCAELNICKDTWNEWEKNQEKGFSDLIKRAKLKVAAGWEKGALNPALSIFLLKNHMQYTDKQEIASVNTNIDIDLSNLPLEALEEIAKAQGQEEVMRIVGKYRK